MQLVTYLQLLKTSDAEVYEDEEDDEEEDDCYNNEDCHYDDSGVGVDGIKVAVQETFLEKHGPAGAAAAVSVSMRLTGLGGHSSDEVDRDKSTIFSSKGAGIPLRRRTGYDYAPTWLQSNSQINANPTSIHIGTLSMHILDQGYGAHALLTVRQVDAEKQHRRLTLEQQSRAGVLGRIVSGVWVKLAEVKLVITFAAKQSGNILFFSIFQICVLSIIIASCWLRFISLYLKIL